MSKDGRRPWGRIVIALLLGLLVAAGYYWRNDIRQAALDPKQPFQVYTPPAVPDYSRPKSWSLLPAGAAAASDPAVDIFFISPTTFSGGRHWNAPIDDAASELIFRRVMAPNYAGPFLRVGRLFAPRYRQASLYSLTTLREDAREARKFAYSDVASAFRAFLKERNANRPFMLVGVEQGGTLGARLLAEEIAPVPAVRDRLVAAYLIETAVPAIDPPLPACRTQTQTGCLAAWASAFEGDWPRAQDIQNRSLVWAPSGDLDNLGGQEPLCFNPVLGAVTLESAPERRSQGAANATGLELGARPPFLIRQVGARCERGILWVSRPRAKMLKPTGSWADRQRMPGYNLFYVDLEADAKARVAAWTLKAASPG